LIPAIATASDLSGQKSEKITKNMVWVDSGKWQFESQKMQKSFWIDRFEVTQKEFFAVMGNNQSFFKGDDHPVEKVTWYDAKIFCEKMGKRLPIEGEWEKAVRAGSSSSFYWGNENPDAYSWHKGNANKKTHPVGSKKPNALGVYDMAGNVWEWTFSNHESGGKVVRGGSWRNGVSSLKASHRINSLPIHKFHYVGFRCVAD
jgi:formylglycine-generating enzyme